MLQSPKYVRAMAQHGFSVPAYAYVGNNPINRTDRTGKYWDIDDWDTWTYLSWLKGDPVLAPYLQRMEDDPFHRFSLNRITPTGDDPVININGGGVCELQPRGGQLLKYDPEFAQEYKGAFGYDISPEALLAHELGHAYDDAYNGGPFPPTSDDLPMFFENEASPPWYFRFFHTLGPQ